MTPELARLVQAATERRQQHKLWLKHLTACATCSGGFGFCVVGQELFTPFKALNEKLDEASDALAAVAQAEALDSRAEQWRTAAEILDEKLTEARAAIRLADPYLRQRDCLPARVKKEWLEHPAVVAAREDKR